MSGHSRLLERWDELDRRPRPLPPVQPGALTLPVARVRCQMVAVAAVLLAVFSGALTGCTPVEDDARPAPAATSSVATGTVDARHFTPCGIACATPSAGAR